MIQVNIIIEETSERVTFKGSARGHQPTREENRIADLIAEKVQSLIQEVCKSEPNAKGIFIQHAPPTFTTLD